MPAGALVGVGSGMGSTAAMTCAGLLGLAVGHGAAADVAKSRDPKAGPRDATKDPRIQAGLLALSTAVGHPVGWKGDGVRAGIPGAGGKAYYFLWSLERVAVAFKLDTIGKKKWYDWGAEILLANQQRDGSWQGEYGGYGVDTCFALLFLRRSNLVRDLSASIRLSDPGVKVLKGGGFGGKSLKGIPDRLAPTGIGEKGKKAPARKGPPTGKKGPPERTRPTPAPTGPAERVARLGKELARASGERADALLRELRAGKGGAYTDALVDAISRMEGEGKRKAREALADRLARLRAASLRAYMKDEDAELRRAAALACTAKRSQEYVPDLIRLLNDRESLVERAAHAALKELTGKDFGPPAGATRAERARAIARWLAWWKDEGR
jgi:hypothetical protein